jgi:RpiB/LacA/LacB family sugar-phosphate isomerase
MKIFLGADHGGFYLKEKIAAYLSKRGIEWEDVGGKELDPNDDFPQFAQMAATKVLGEDDATDPRAILIYTGGQGMAMAANRLLCSSASYSLGQDTSVCCSARARRLFCSRSVARCCRKSTDKYAEKDAKAETAIRKDSA